MTIAVGLLALSLAVPRPAAAGLSADDVVARSVAARGGLDAWRKVGTMVWIGHVESAHTTPPTMPFRLDQKRPNKTRLEMDSMGNRALRVFDGVHGWKVPPSRGKPEVQPYSPQELKSAQAGHGIDGPLLDHAAKGNSVSLAGMDEVGGRKAYHLKVRLAREGGEEDVWVDAGTFLEVRYDRDVETPNGETRRVSMTYGDYRAVEGLQIPFLIETGAGSGATPDRMRIERVVLNVPMDDSSFLNPAYAHRGTMSRQRAGLPAPAQGTPRAPPSAPGTEPGTAMP